MGSSRAVVSIARPSRSKARRISPLPRESVRYYHDFADTIDKLPAKIVVDSTAVIGDLVLALAADADLQPHRRSPEDTLKIFTTFGLEHRMQGTGYWPFPPEPAR